MERREKLGAEIRFLGGVLGDVIKEHAGSVLFDLEEEIRLGARARREGTPGAAQALGARIRSMSDAEARRSVDITFAPVRRVTPLMTAAFSFNSMSAPSRVSSGTCLKRSK